MLKITLIGLAILIAAFVIIIAIQPSEFRIARSATIAAAPAAVFEQINDLHNWNGWSPWAKLDPNAVNTFSGAPAGEGASFAWAGNNDVGQGKMTITESKPMEKIVMSLVFEKPFAATNQTEFTLTPAGAGTAVTWAMTGHNNFVGKAMSMVVNCDKMVGGQFEQGFENLKGVLEKSAAGK